jgi:hypothetical protein
MPLIKRAESDILRLKPIVHGYVNPCTVNPSFGAGLGKVFDTEFPGLAEAYVKEYEKNKLFIGTHFTYKTKNSPVEIINLPTKGHFADAFDIKDVKKSLQTLRNVLESKKYYHCAMPMLGYALKDADKELCEKLNYEYLDDLPCIIHVCMRPEAFKVPPKYLAIIGSQEFSDIKYMEDKLLSILKRWNLKPEDFDAWVSGGAKGADTLGCGRSLLDKTYETSLAKKYSPRRPIHVLADFEKYGRSAGYIRNPVIGDIATHVIAFLDERKKPSPGTRHTLKWLKGWNEKYPDQRKEVIACSLS